MVVSVYPSYIVVGATGVEGKIAATIENSLDKAPVPIKLRAYTINL